MRKFAEFVFPRWARLKAFTLWQQDDALFNAAVPKNEFVNGPPKSLDVTSWVDFPYLAMFNRDR